MSEVIEIRDPKIDQQATQERIQMQLAQRLANGIYEADFSIPGPRALHQSPPGIADSAGVEFSGLTQALLELTTITTLREPVFTSSVPIFGPLIILFRRCWNWMSTKWYVLPVIRQQSLINKRISLIVDELEHWQALQTQRLIDLQVRVEALEARLMAQGGQ